MTRTNDNIDSLKLDFNDSNLIIPIKNIINDAYLNDISVKIRSQLEVKRKNGEFISAFATYGYLRDPQNKNKLIVDEMAAPIVMQIFKLKFSGVSCENIAKMLNDNNIPSPLEHKKILGLNYYTGFKQKEISLWTANSVLRILKNDIYIGTLTQGKVTTPNYKVKKKVYKPKENWAIIENNHQTIIDKKMFKFVQENLLLDTRTSPEKTKIYPLSGICFCGDCKNSMVRKNNGTSQKPYYYYICSGYKKKSCSTSHLIRDEILENSVLYALNEIIRTNSDFDKLSEKIDFLELQKNYHEKMDFDNSDENIQRKKLLILEYQNKKSTVYQHFLEKIIDEEEFIKFTKIFEEKIVKEEKNLKLQEEKIKFDISENDMKTKNYKNNNKNMYEEFIENYKILKLSRNLVASLISEIYVFDNKNILIKLKANWR